MLNELISFPEDWHYQIQSMVEDFGALWHRTGSAAWFGKGHDLDVTVLVKPQLTMPQVAVLLARSGWEVFFNYHSQEHLVDSIDFDVLEDEDWFPARKGQWNLLLYRNPEHYSSMEKTTNLCHGLVATGTLKPEDKTGRVLIFQSIVGI